VTTPAKPRIRRVNHGKGHSYYLNDVKVPGATTVLNKGYPKHLEKWAADQSAAYAINHWDELAELGPADRLKPIADARFADRDAAARRGTEVHRLVERYLAGPDVQVPDELVGHVDAYIRFVEDWQPRELLVEAPVASVRFGYCGTVDVVADLADDLRWLYDVKTTRSGVFREAVLQVAAYRHADYYLDPDGEIQPMLPVDRCGVVWLRADRSYEFVPVEANEQAFAIFRAAHLIARFEERDDFIGAPLDPPNGRSTS
jgi:hypothetical protein